MSIWGTIDGVDGHKAPGLDLKELGDVVKKGEENDWTEVEEPMEALEVKSIIITGRGIDSPMDTR